MKNFEKPSIQQNILKIISFVLLGITLSISFILDSIILKLNEFSKEYDFFMKLPILLLIILTVLALLISKQARFLALVPAYWIIGVVASLMGYIMSVLIASILLQFINALFQSTLSNESPYLVFWITTSLMPFVSACFGIFLFDNFLRPKVYTYSKYLLLAIACISQIFAFSFWTVYSHWWFVN